MNRWMAVLCPVTALGGLTGRALKYASPLATGGRYGVTQQPPLAAGGGESAGDAYRLMGLNRWETEWAAHGADLLRILKAL